MVSFLENTKKTSAYVRLPEIIKEPLFLTIGTSMVNLEEISPLESLGFNEVMLAVGEDNLLKKRVKEKKLRLGLLEGLSVVCVAGLDMVNVIKDRDTLIRIFSDMNKISKIKKKPIGTRLIPTTSNSIKISKFGEIPIIEL